jgi:large subunit ribosomal protein L25
MDGLKIQADKREILGKKVRFLRREGITPAHVFGHNVESLALQCDTDSLQRIIEQAGTTRLVALKIEGDESPKSVLIREIQKDAISGQLLHVDFYQIRKTEKIKADIPFVFVGEAPAMHLKGRILAQELSSISVECLPDRLPPQIEIDLTSLEELGQAIHVSDIALGPDITLITPSDRLIVRVSEIRVKIEEEEIVAEEEVAEEAEVEEGAEPEAEAKAEAGPEQQSAR